MNRSGQLGLLTALVCLFGSSLSAQTPAPSATPKSPPNASCSLPGFTRGQSASLREADLLAIYNAQSKQVESLQIDSLVGASSGKAGQHSARRVATAIHFQSPGFLRITGFAPFLSSRAFDLASDGRQFRLLLPVDRQMKLFSGPTDAPALSPDPKQNLRPQPIADALRWPQGELSPSPSPRRPSHLHRSIEILLPSVAGKPRTAKANFDLATGTVSSLEVSSPGLGLVSQIQYADWRQTENPSGESPVCFPRHITIRQPKDSLLLDLQLLHIAINPQIPAARFLLIPPRGISQVSLSRPGDANAP